MSSTWATLQANGLHMTLELFMQQDHAGLQFYMSRLKAVLEQMPAASDEWKVVKQLENIFTWRMAALDLLGYCPKGVKYLENQVDSWKVIESSDKYWKYVSVPEHKQLTILIQHYYEWEKLLFEYLPADQLHARVKRAKVSAANIASDQTSWKVPSPAYTSTSGVASFNNIAFSNSVVAKPSFTWLERVYKIMKDQFPNLTTRETEACTELYRTSKLKNDEVLNAIVEIEKLYHARASGQRRSLVLGLNGLQVLNYRRLFEETTYLKVYLESAQTLAQHVELYDFLVLLKDVLFSKYESRKLTSTPTKKLRLLEESMPVHIRKRFQEEVIPYKSELSDIDEKTVDSNSDTFLLSLLKRLLMDAHALESRTSELAQTALATNTLNVDHGDKTKPPLHTTVKSLAPAFAMNTSRDLNASNDDAALNMNEFVQLAEEDEVAVVDSKEAAHRKAKFDLIALASQIPFRYKFGWILNIGEVLLDPGYHKSKVIFPLGFSTIFRFPDLLDPSQPSFYKFDIEKGPSFQITLLNKFGQKEVAGFSSVGSIAKRFSDRFKYWKRAHDVLPYIFKTGEDLNCSKQLMQKIVGLDDPVISKMIEGLPYSMHCEKYIYSRLRFDSSLHLGENVPRTDFSYRLLEEFQKSLDLAVLKSVPIAVAPKNKVVDTATRQGKKFKRSFFKITDYSKLGKTLRETLSFFGKELQASARRQRLEASFCEFLAILPGMLITLDQGEIKQKQCNNTIPNMLTTQQKILSVLQKDWPEHYGQNLETRTTEVESNFKELKTSNADLKDHIVRVSCADNGPMRCSLDTMEPVNRNNYGRATAKKVTGSPKNVDLQNLPDKLPHFDDYFLVYRPVDSPKLRIEKLPPFEPIIDAENWRKMKHISNKVANLYSSRLSNLPCDIFLSSNCTCGHPYHSPRISILLRAYDLVVSACTVCVTSLGFTDGSPDMCLLEIEGIATDKYQERTGLAGVLLLFLRLFSLNLERDLGKTVGMVAKTSSTSEHWWNQRQGFFSSLRELKKELSLEDYNNRWRVAVDESGAKNHQFFCHTEVQGRSVFWISAPEVDLQQRIGQELDAFYKRSFPTLDFSDFP